MANPPSVSFDPSPYVRSPVLNIASGVALAQSLLAVSPGPFAAPLKKSRARLKATLEAALEGWADKQRLDATLPRLSLEEKRTLDQLADRGWGALRLRLEAYALLPPDIAKAKKARHLLETLFPQGTEFLKWRFAEQFAAMDVLLKRITDEGHAADVNEVCGADFLTFLKDVHPAYRDMVQKRPAVSVDADVNLTAHVRALSEAVADYAIKVCAQVEQDDPATWAQVKTLLAPIDDLREGQARSEPPKPTPPSPEPDPATP